MFKFIVLIIFVLQAVVLQLSCGSSIESQSSKVRPVKEYEERARAIAREWYPDAYMFSVAIQPLSQHTTPLGQTPDQLSFQFVSPSNTWESLDVTFSLNGTPEIRKWSLARSPNEYLPIHSSDWTLDSTDAWRIALDEIQTAGVNSTDINATMHLERWNPPRTGQVLWYVANRGSGPSTSVRIWIDPITGEIVDKK